MAFLSSNWHGNTVLRWLLAAGVFLLTPILVRIIGSILKRQTRSGAGKGRWFPSIAEAVRRPIGALLWIASLWVICHELLTPPEWLGLWADRLLYMALLLALGWLLSHLANTGVESYLTRAAERSERPVDGLLAPLFRGGARILVWSVVLMLGLDNAGYKLSAVLGGLGLGGLAVAMAAKDLISDVLGGIAIMLNRPFAVGDKIVFKGQWATVLDFGLRTTTLQDFASNFKYVVPNSHFTHNEVTNISDHPGNMILMNIRLSLTHSADQIELALSLIQDILRGHSEIRYIWSKLDHFDDYAFTLRIHYDILEFRHRIRVKSEINLAIARAFQKHGIKFAAMPVRTIQDAAAPNTSDAYVG